MQPPQRVYLPQQQNKREKPFVLGLTNVDIFHSSESGRLEEYNHTVQSVNALLSSRMLQGSDCPVWASASCRLSSHLTSPLSQQSSLQNKGRKQQALWYIFVFERLWFIIQLPPNMFQLGSGSCWGLAAAVANRQLNIYILLSSGKQTPFWGSAVRAVKSFHLCTCLHNSYDIFVLNECKFYLNHDPARGLSVWQNAYAESAEGQTISFFLHERGLERGWSPCGRSGLCPGSSQWGQCCLHTEVTEQGSSSGP